MSPDLFQIKDANKSLRISTIWLLARCANPGIYEAVLTIPKGSTILDDATTFSLAKVNQFGGLHFSQQSLSAVRSYQPMRQCYGT